MNYYYALYGDPAFPDTSFTIPGYNGAELFYLQLAIQRLQECRWYGYCY